MSRRHHVAGVITARRGRALVAVDPETQARILLDPTVLDVTPKHARAARQHPAAPREVEQRAP